MTMSEHLGYPQQVFKMGDYRDRNYDRYDPCSQIAAEGVADITRSIHNHNISTAAGFCDTQKAIGDAECRLSNRMADDFGKVMLHQAALERDLQNQIHLVNKDALVQFGDQKLQICELGHSLSRQLSDCCCEMKQEIASVKELIKDNEISRLKDELQKEQFQRMIQNACCGTPAPTVRVP